VTALESQVGALNERLVALEAAAKPREAPKQELPKKTEKQSIVNLERSAYSRPIPRGLVIGGYVQAQYESNQLSENQLAQGGSPLNFDRFSVRRGRLRLDHGWEYAAATLELDANTYRGATVSPRRAEASLFYRGKNSDDLPPLVMATLGLTDIPFGYELFESARTRPFMERSLGSGALFPNEMDAGLKVSGAVSFVRYAVALMNGEPVTEGKYPRDPNAAKDWVGRVGVDVKPSQRIVVFGGTSFAVGKGFHPGSDAIKGEVTWRDDNEDNAVQSTEIVAVPGVAATPSKNFRRWAIGLDLGVKLKTDLGDSKLYGEAFVASNYDRGLIGADPVADGVDLRHAGGYAAFLQDITEYGLVGFRISVYDPNSDVLESRRGNLLPQEQTITTLSPLIGARLPDVAKLYLQYDFVRDHLARDKEGVPTDADNNQFTVRLQVEL
jgi:hypothetical protein